MHFEHLTPKQREVLALLADGRTSKEMARALDVSPSAVNQRIDSIRRRFGGVSRSELGRAYRNAIRLESAASDKVERQSCHFHEPARHGKSKSSDEYPATLQLENSMSFGREPPSAKPYGPAILPRVHESNNAGLIRGAAIATIVAGILSSLTLVFVIAQVLTELISKPVLQ